MHASAASAWVYPLQGAYWLASSPTLLSIVLGFLVNSVVAAVAAVAGWSWLTYSWHAKVLGLLFGTSGLFGALGRLAALSCVLGESLSAVAVLLKKRADGLQAKLFLETLRLKGVERVAPVDGGEAARLRAEVAAARAAATAVAKQQQQQVRRRRGLLQQEKQGGSSTTSSATTTTTKVAAGLATALAMRAGKGALSLLVPGDTDGGLWRAARSLALAPVKMLLPPIIPLLSLLEGRDEALSLNRHYLELKGLNTPEERAKVADANALAFRSFGAACRLLGEVPVASIAFGLSNAVAAGLWAADTEKSGGGKLLGGG
jgi:hypothetical protein